MRLQHSAAVMLAVAATAATGVASAATLTVGPNASTVSAFDIPLEGCGTGPEFVRWLPENGCALPEDEVGGSLDLPADRDGTPVVGDDVVPQDTEEAAVPADDVPPTTPDPDVHPDPDPGGTDDTSVGDDAPGTENAIGTDTGTDTVTGTDADATPDVEDVVTP